MFLLILFDRNSNDGNGDGNWLQEALHAAIVDSQPRVPFRSCQKREFILFFHFGAFRCAPLRVHCESPSAAQPRLVLTVICPGTLGSRMKKMLERGFTALAVGGRGRFPRNNQSRATSHTK